VSQSHEQNDDPCISGLTHVSGWLGRLPGMSLTGRDSAAENSGCRTAELESWARDAAWSAGRRSVAVLGVAFLLALSACTARPHYYVVEYDVARRAEVAATTGAPAISGGVKLTHCDSALCERLAVHVRAAAKDNNLIFTPNGATTLHLDDVTLGGAAAILYEVPRVRYVFQTAPDKREEVEVQRDVETVEARCRSRFYAFLDQTEEIRGVTRVHVTLRRGEQTVWEVRSVHGDEALIDGDPRFIYRAGDNFILFGRRRSLAKARVHDAVCRDSRVEYPLLGAGKAGFGTPRRREVMLFARSVEFTPPDLDGHLQAAADELVSALTAPGASAPPLAADSVPVETPPAVSDPESGTDAPRSD
jgi:hypothetical protein